MYALTNRAPGPTAQPKCGQLCRRETLKADFSRDESEPPNRRDQYSEEHMSRLHCQTVPRFAGST